jgi:hypothetical protein
MPAHQVPHVDVCTPVLLQGAQGMLVALMCGVWLRFCCLNQSLLTWFDLPVLRYCLYCGTACTAVLPVLRYRLHCRERLQRSYDGFHSSDAAGASFVDEYEELPGPNLPVPGGYQVTQGGLYRGWEGGNSQTGAKVCRETMGGKERVGGGVVNPPEFIQGRGGGL